METVSLVGLSTIIIACLICNISALVFIVQKKRSNLTIKDKTVAIVCGINTTQVFPYSVELFNQINGLTEFTCNAGATLICSLTYTSIGYFVFLAVERYISVLYPLKSYRWFHEIRIDLWLCLPPLIGVALGAAPLIGLGGYGKSRGDALYCGLSFADSGTSSLSYFIALVVLMLILPLLVTSVCFIAIIVELRRKDGAGPRMVRSANQQFKSYIMTGLMYFVSWIPYTIVCLRLYMGQPVSVGLENAAMMLSKSSTISSPIVFCIVEKQFQDFIRRPKSANV